MTFWICSFSIYKRRLRLEVASSRILAATGKTPTEVNKSITLTEAGLLDFLTIKINNESEMVVDLTC